MLREGRVPDRGGHSGGWRAALGEAQAVSATAAEAALHTGQSVAECKNFLSQSAARQNTLVMEVGLIAKTLQWMRVST